MSSHVGHGAAAEVVARSEAVDGFAGVDSEWDTLAESSGGGIFGTALWSRTWWKHFGGDRELLLRVSRTSDGSLAVVLPLYAWRRRLPRIIRFLGHGVGDELGPTCAADEEETAAVALSRALEALDWDVFFGEQLRGTFAWSPALSGRSWRREAAPILRLPATWDAYLANRSSNFRQQLRRREDAVRASGRVVFRRAEAGTVQRDLDTLFGLHSARWEGATTDFSDTTFHREIAEAAVACGWLRLWLLEVDGRAIAAWHGFQVGTVASYYQAGRDPAAEHLSAGFVLMAHTIRAAIAEGATEYRFGRGDEAFKRRWTQDDPGLETLALTRGPLGACTYAAGRVVRAVRRRSRS